MPTKYEIATYGESSYIYRGIVISRNDKMRNRVGHWFVEEMPARDGGVISVKAFTRGQLISMIDDVMDGVFKASEHTVLGKYRIKRFEDGQKSTWVRHGRKDVGRIFKTEFGYTFLPNTHGRESGMKVCERKNLEEVRAVIGGMFV